MKSIITMAACLFSLTAYSQVGINTNNPKASLDISAKTTDGSKPEGLIAPRLTGDQIRAGDNQYGTAQKGAILYATSAVTSPSTKTANITAEGYYFFDGTSWQKITGAASAGDTTNDAWINDTANSMVKLGTKSDGTARTAGTDFVARDNGSVGIGTSAPDASAALEVNSSSKGMLIPKVALTGVTDVTTIPSPASGLIAYNTATTINGPGIVFNRGTASSPKWSSVQVYSSDQGGISGKLVYQAYPDPTKTILVGNLEFRAIYSGDLYSFQIRMLTPPSGTANYYCDRIAWFGANNATTTNTTLSFNSSNYNIWQTYTAGSIGALVGSSVGFLTYISSADDSLYYRINNHSKFNTNSFTSFVIEAF